MIRNHLTALLLLAIAPLPLHAENEAATTGRSITLGSKNAQGIEVTLSGVNDPSLNGPKIITGLRDGRITFRDPKTGKDFFLEQADFTESDLAKVREAIVPFQATVKSLGCQVDRFLSGNTSSSLWFNKGAGMKRPGDLGVDGIPPVSSNVRIRGLTTTYPFEVPVRVVILWLGASASARNRSHETGFTPGSPKSQSSPNRCMTHFAMEDYDLTIQGTPCDLYSLPVHRCGAEHPYCELRHDKHVVVVINRTNQKLLYTNSTDASLVAVICEADRRGVAAQNRVEENWQLTTGASARSNRGLNPEQKAAKERENQRRQERLNQQKEEAQGRVRDLVIREYLRSKEKSKKK